LEWNLRAQCEHWRANFWDPRPDPLPVYHIVKGYYETIAGRSEERRHDLAREVFAIISSAGAPVEAAVLGVSVAIETLVNATFPELKKSSPEFINAVESFRTNLSSLKLSNGSDLKLSAEMQRRLNGSLDRMKEQGVANAIRALLPKLQLENRLYDSWNTLRNNYAHGGAIPLSRIGEIHDHVRNVIYLAWSIVLSSIDYKGPRTNYSLRGRPRVTANGETIKDPSMQNSNASS
jgi:hypothetical protein